MGQYSFGWGGMEGLMRSRGIVLKLFLALVWCVCLYRAVTQSFVHDEALTYSLYVAGPVSAIFQYFDANHHFLNTILMKLSATLFGASEWSLRLPALAGAALYLAAVYRITTRAIRGNGTALLTAALLVLNPFILDFMVAARGYGMALGLWMWAMAILAEYVRTPRPGAARELFQAGAALALSVMANLVFVIPAAVLAVCSGLMLKKAAAGQMLGPAAGSDDKKREKKRKRSKLEDERRPLRTFSRWLVTPFLCGLALLFVISPLSMATSRDFYHGVDTLAASLRSMYKVSLAHGGPLQADALLPGLRDAVAFVVAPAILLAGLAVGIRRRSVLLTMASATAVGSGLLLVVSHAAFGLLYPLDRTGIYFLALVGLALASLADEANGENPMKAVGAVACAISVLFIAQFALEFNTRKFFVWEYDADTRTIFAEIAKLAKDERPGAIRISNSWQLEPSLNFYAMKENPAWLQPITRAPIQPGADYYVFIEMDRPATDRLHLRTLYRGPNSETVLAVPTD